MIRELLAAARLEAPRDPKQAAVSDLYGCDRATWFRRNGYEMPLPDDATLRKFDVGHAVESRIIHRLRAQGEAVRTEQRVVLSVTDDGHLLGSTVEDDDVPAADEITGHPDAFLLGSQTLLEIKTTDVRKPEAVAKPHYALQAAAYALALGAKRTVVHVTHVATFTKDETEHEIDAEAWRPRIIERIGQVLSRTAPGSDMPDAEPPIESAAWACRYCPVAQCERNKNPDALELQEAIPW